MHILNFREVFMELEYIKINTSSGCMYGGDQKLFGINAAKSGCGMIAACDMLLFLKGKNSVPISFTEYSDFVSDFRDNTAYRRSLHRFGIFPRRLVKMINGCIGERAFVFRRKSRFSENSLADLIERSLKNGFPVIVRIGKNGKKLPYTITYPASGSKRRTGKMEWHYVTVTGINENGEIVFSSWGGKGVMSLSELYKHFGITGGVIARKDMFCTDRR